eukprot:4728638-Pyramimonas_sp.AAC.1
MGALVAFGRTRALPVGVGAAAAARAGASAGGASAADAGPCSWARLRHQREGALQRGFESDDAMRHALS